MTDGETSKSCSAFAREPLNKKGFDEAQITGASSSYARKYALNGMYNIDDSKDADTNEFRTQANNNAKQQVKSNTIDFDVILKTFTGAASSANEKMLKKLFGQAWKDLSTSKSHQGKAKEIYDIRVNELNQTEQ